MKRIILLIAFLMMMEPNLNAIPAKKFGIGISAGEPTGISMKYWLNPKTALEGVVGYSISDYHYYYSDHDKYRSYDSRYWDDHHAVYVHLDYLLHHKLVNQLYFSYGIGGRVIFHENMILGLRIPLGLTYLFTEVPLDVSLDLVPVLNVIPETDFRFEPSISLRFNL